MYDSRLAPALPESGFTEGLACVAEAQAIDVLVQALTAVTKQETAVFLEEIDIISRVDTAEAKNHEAILQRLLATSF